MTPSPTPPGDIIWWLLRRQKGWIALGITMGIIWMASFAAGPIVVGEALDDLIDDPDPASAAWWGAAVVGVYAVGAIAGAVRHRAAVGLFARSRWMVEQRISDRMLHRAGGVERPPAEVLSVSIGDAGKIGAVADLTNRGSGAVVVLVFVAIWLLSTSVTLGLLVLIAVPLAGVIVSPFLRSYDRRSTTERAQLAEATASAADGITGLRVVQGLGGGTEIRRWFHARSALMHDAALGLVRLESVLFALMAMLPNLTLVPVLWVGGNQAIDGEISPGTLITVVGLAQFLSTPIFTLSEVAQVVTAGRASARRATAILDDPTAIDDREGDARPAGGPLAVSLHSVSAADIVGADLTVAAGSVVGIACARNRDAATLARLLARHLDPTEGSITVGDHDLADLPLPELHRVIVVGDTERPWLLSSSLIDNLRLADADIDDAGAAAALHTAAADEIMRRRDPLQTELGERGLRLSGGQRQRIAVARSLIADAGVLVLHEPTSALDAATEELLVERLAQSDLPTLIVITTSPAVLAACDEVAFVVDGRIADVGPHARLDATSDEYRRLMRGGA